MNTFFMSPGRSPKIAVAVLGFHFLFFFILNLFIHPHPDMLDHWVWSRFLAWSYYEHPPMVAWVFRTITLLGGNHEMSLEVGSQIYNLLICVLAYGISVRLFGTTAGLMTLLLLCSTLYFTLGSIFLHIDQAYLIFWLINLYFLVRYHQTQKIRWLMGIGVIAGLGALSKYITLLFYMGMGIHFLLYKPLRRQWLNPWLYVAGLVSLIIFTPVLWWNYQNHWVSFLFQFKRGLSGAPLGQNAIFFTLGHLMLFSPVWSWWCFQNLWKKRSMFANGSSPESVIIVVSSFPLIFFTMMSFRGDIADPHWVNVSYLGFMILAGKILAESVATAKTRWMLALGIVFNLLLIGVAILHVFHPLGDVMQYKLENYTWLQRKGVPENVQQELKTMKARYYGAEPFFKELQSRLSDEDFQRYSPLIQRAAMRTLSDPVAPMLGWPETANAIVELLKKNQLPMPRYVISKEYQLGGALSFYLPDFPWPHSLEKPERNQWSLDEDVLNNNSIFVCDLPKCERAREHFAQKFTAPLQYLGDVVTESNHRVVRTLEVYSVGQDSIQRESGF
ncbi:MAG: glycosyltransferase family 39 protein [SAR324 cluster bacterium]|nr:glycosyltransferase family 39 protein [SAR324 cluster bacterium]